jgi:hypothetical protein
MNRRGQSSRKHAAAKVTRNTLPKAIAASYKSGDRNEAMDLAVFGRETTVLTALARDLYWFCRVQHPKGKEICVSMSSGGERHGWEPPRRQSLRERKQSFQYWNNCKAKELLAQIETGGIWYNENFLADLEREFDRVCKEDANIRPFERFGNKQNPRRNPNWFRQILIANLGLVKTKVWDKQLKRLHNRKPLPLAPLGNEFGFNVGTLNILRREMRKMGAKQGKAGRPKKR